MPERIIIAFCNEKCILLNICIKYLEKGYGFSEAWREMMKESTLELLDTEEKELIAELGGGMGRCDIEGEIARINRIMSRIEKFYNRRADEENEKKRMCISLGVLVGVFILIILL